MARVNGTGLRVLVSAYACEPGRGSEPGVGWHWVREIARFNEVWVITRMNNRKAIETALAVLAGECEDVRSQKIRD